MYTVCRHYERYDPSTFHVVEYGKYPVTGQPQALCRCLRKDRRQGLLKDIPFLHDVSYGACRGQQHWSSFREFLFRCVKLSSIQVISPRIVSFLKKPSVQQRHRLGPFEYCLFYRRATALDGEGIRTEVDEGIH